MQTLVIDLGFRPVELVGWEKALLLLLKGKAEPLVISDHIVRSIRLSFNIPRVIQIKQNINIKIDRKRAFRKKDVFERDGWMCQYCGTLLKVNKATIDHVLPRSRGGANSYENCVASCESCNRKKANKTPEEAGMRLRSKPKAPLLFCNREISRAYNQFISFGIDNSDIISSK